MTTSKFSLSEVKMSPPRDVKHIGLLFHPFMVEALKMGRKHVTRRTRGLEIVNKRPDKWELVDFDGVNAKFTRKYHEITQKTPETLVVKNPYGQHGDYIWSRETCWIHRGFKAGQNDAALQPNNVYFRADHPNFGSKEFIKEHYKLYPSIHMPKAACRHWANHRGVSLERLHDLTEHDALREGIYYGDDPPPFDGFTYDGILISPTAKDAFKHLWEHINGKGSWEHNPWVWVINFSPTITRPKLPWE